MIQHQPSTFFEFKVNSIIVVVAVAAVADVAVVADDAVVAAVAVVNVVAAAAVDWCCAALRPLQMLGHVQGVCITAAGGRGRAGWTILLHLSLG